MVELPVCHWCRHPFTPSAQYKNRVTPIQEYCSKPACQLESARASKRRYRLRDPEDPGKVRLRVRNYRARKRGTGIGTEASPRDANSRTGAHGDIRVAVEAIVLAEITRVGTNLAAAIAREACNGISDSLVDQLRMGIGAPLSAQISTSRPCNGMSEFAGEPHLVAIHEVPAAQGQGV